MLDILSDSPLNTGVLKASRWEELQDFAKIAIDIANIFNEDGNDVYFLNRPAARNVKSIYDVNYNPNNHKDRFRNYFLIQLTAILNLMGCLMSFLYLIAFNIVVLVFKLLSTNQCDTICISVRSLMILLGVCLSILNVSFYITIQFNFLVNVNRSFDAFI
jgi:hypothetical protein